MRRMGWVMGLGVLVCGFGAGQGIAQAATNAGLDGTRWKIRAVPDEAARKQGEKASRDTLIFQDGRMTSTACTRYGFSASSYTANQSGGSWAFNAEQTSDKQGKTAWSGQANGETINGTMVWTTKDGRTVRYAFEGKPARPIWRRWAGWFHRSGS